MIRLHEIIHYAFLMYSLTVPCLKYAEKLNKSQQEIVNVTVFSTSLTLFTVTALR